MSTDDENAPATAPAPEPAEVPLSSASGAAPTEAPSPRPMGVLIVGALGLLLTAAGAYALADSPPDEPTLLVTLALLLVLFAYVHYEFFKGEGWARAMIMGIALFAIGLSLVAIALSGGEGNLAETWQLPVALIVIEGAVLAYVLAPEVSGWFTPVAWRESLSDVKWAVALLFLTMLALFGLNNDAWSAKPAGRESIPRLVDLFLSGDAPSAGGELPLVFLLQLLGVLLVAGLIASIVLAMRDPKPGEEADSEVP